MEVIKRNGVREAVSFDKISQRLSTLCRNVHQPYLKGKAYGHYQISRRVKDKSLQVTGGPLLHADPVKIVQRVSVSIYDGVSTEEIDVLTAEVAETLKTSHPEYGILAARIVISNLHKSTPDTLRGSVELLGPGRWDKMLYERLTTDDALCNSLEDAMDHARSYGLDYFGAKTMIKGYLLSKDGRPAERPQYMWMRVALHLHGPDRLDRVLETYELLSCGYFTHASPTLFNAGTSHPQDSSCFLYGMAEDQDSIEGIFDTLKKCALISKWGGGLGIHIHSIRSNGADIRGTAGKATGIVPMLRNFEALARYVNQGGKRKGSIAIYLEPWHADVFDFLELRKNSGKEEMRCRDLFTALWVPDLFIRRVEQDGAWSLFDPDKARGLPDCYGEEFDELYKKYEAIPGLASRVVRAKAVWSAMLTAQVEGGTPYVLYKDAVNHKSNQKHLGTIKSSNLCAEITEFTAKDEVAVCSLASLALPQFVTTDSDHGLFFDMEKLREVTKVAIRNLDLVVDRTFYPVPEAHRSNMLHRPLGLGVQGLADVFMMLRMPFSSPAARALNRAIFQSIYYAAVEASVDLAAELGPYPTFDGSPASKGFLQFDLWGVKPSEMGYDWAGLKARIVKVGMRNSLLTSVMPTASTGQLLGNVEAAEAISSNLYVRRTLAGEFVVANSHLMADLVSRGLWGEAIKDQIMANRGSIQAIPEIPDDLKELYKTTWEIKQKVVIDLAADRGIFIDQSQSMNIFMSKPTPASLSSALVYAHKLGLKTGMYYLRTLPSTAPTAVTVPVKRGKKEKVVEKSEKEVVCTDEVCVSCSA